MKQQSFQWSKVVPWLLALCILATVTLGIVWITSQPDVIRAKGDWANATANLFEAKQGYHEQLPEILNKATILAVAGFLSFAALAFVLSISVNLVIHNVDRVVAHGWEFEKNAGGQRTTYKLLHTNPAPYKLPGGQPKITVEQPTQGMLGRGQGQSLPGGNQKGNPNTGRPQRPEEKQAQGKLPINNNSGQSLPHSLMGGGPSRLSKEDPLSSLYEEMF